MSRAGTWAESRERELLTTLEVARRYKFSDGPHALRWCRRHGVPQWNRVGRRVLFDARDIDLVFQGRGRRASTADTVPART